MVRRPLVAGEPVEQLVERGLDARAGCAEPPERRLGDSGSCSRSTASAMWVHKRTGSSSPGSSVTHALETSGLPASHEHTSIVFPAPAGPLTRVSPASAHRVKGGEEPLPHDDAGPYPRRGELRLARRRRLAPGRGAFIVASIAHGSGTHPGERHRAHPATWSEPGRTSRPNPDPHRRSVMPQHGGRHRPPGC